MAIYQADQYMIPFSIRQGKDIVTPEMISDVTIVLGELVKSYGKSELSFLDGKWLFPLTREESINMAENVKYQIEVKVGNNILHSKPMEIKVKSSLYPFIKEQ